MEEGWFTGNVCIMLGFVLARAGFWAKFAVQIPWRFATPMLLLLKRGFLRMIGWRGSLALIPIV